MPLARRESRCFARDEYEFTHSVIEAPRSPAQ
jgi:hypothetical protein